MSSSSSSWVVKMGAMALLYLEHVAIQSDHSRAKAWVLNCTLALSDLHKHKIIYLIIIIYFIYYNLTIYQT